MAIVWNSSRHAATKLFPPSENANAEIPIDKEFFKRFKMKITLKVFKFYILSEFQICISDLIPL